MKIGILWDIENVTPPSGMNYVRAIVDAVSLDGELSYAIAFGDWSEARLKEMADEMAASNFELIHTPHSGKKNSTDMALVARGVELIFQYPNIERFVLVSGDGDFRPLLLTQKKHGKETWVVCDLNNSASEDLIKMADHSLDYRDIIREEEDDFEEQKDLGNETGDSSLSKERAFELFEETLGLMLKANNKTDPGGVKSRMRLLNPQFDEKALGYGSWQEFAREAKKAKRIKSVDGLLVFRAMPTSTMPSVFKALVEQVTELQSDNGWAQFSVVAPQIDFKGSGYKKFIDLVLDAEKRGYVSTRKKRQAWSIKSNVT